MTTVARQPARVVRGMDDVRRLVGNELGVSAWFEITQSDVSAFAQLTGDLFWIHTDVARAAETPWGTTIAHGLYTLSLGPRFMEEIVRWEDLGVMQNYGYERVRFTAPLPVGSRVRARMRLESVDGVRKNAVGCRDASRTVCQYARHQPSSLRSSHGTGRPSPFWAHT